MGHERLFSHTMHPAEMHFICRACGKSWKREPGTASGYTWEPIKAPFGMDVPGRPGTAPP